MASVFLGDLDDFIAPGQACINPLFVLPDPKPVASVATTTAAEAATGAATAAAAEVKRGNAPMQLMLEDDEGPGYLDAVQVRYRTQGVKLVLLIPSTRRYNSES